MEQNNLVRINVYVFGKNNKQLGIAQYSGYKWPSDGALRQVAINYLAKIDADSGVYGYGVRLDNDSMNTFYLKFEKNLKKREGRFDELLAPDSIK